MPSADLDTPPRPALASRATLTVYGARPDEARAFSAVARRAGVVPTITSVPASVHTAAYARGSRWVSVDHTTRLDAATLRALAAVGVEHLSTRSIGVDHLDLDAADEAGITVENVLYGPDGVADHTLMLLLLALRSGGETLAAVARRDLRLPPVRGRELRDLTVGVVGTGRIGVAVIERLRGFGCRVVAFDGGRRAAGVEYLPLDELLAASDAVTLHLPLTAATHHLLDAERIARMRPGAVLVNTGRGGLLGTVALLDALDRGHLRGAGLDVVEGEDGVFGTDRRGLALDPLLERLLAHPAVVLTPHSAFATEGVLRDIVEATVARVVELERSRE